MDSVKIKYNQIAHLFSPDINLSISPSIGWLWAGRVIADSCEKTTKARRGVARGLSSRDAPNWLVAAEKQDHR
jgi:hypothetical protein